MKTSPNNNTNLEEKETLTPAKKAKKGLKIALAVVGGIFVLFVALILILANVGKASIKNNDVKGRIVEAEFIGDDAHVTLSDNIYDFTFTLDGVNYAIPCSVDKFLAHGWNFSTTSTSAYDEIAGGGTTNFTLARGDNKVSMFVYNPWNETKAIKECKVYEISVESEIASFSYMGGNDIYATPLDVIAHNGPASEFYISDTKCTADYINPADQASRIHIARNSDSNYSKVTLTNKVLFEEIFYEKLNPMQFTIEGNTYTMPCSVEAMLNDGWSFTNDSIAEESVPGHEQISTSLTKNNEKIQIYLYNANAFAKPARYCRVGQVEFTEKNTVTLCGDIKSKITAEKLTEVLGEPVTTNKGGSADYYYYYTDSTHESGLTYWVRKDGIYNATLKAKVLYDNETVSDRATRPDFYDEYQAPATVDGNSDEFSFSIGGDNYKLPVPVTEFLNNGWMIVTSEGNVYGGSENNITLYKDGIVLPAVVKNFSDKMLTVEDCAVVVVKVDGTSLEKHEWE